MAVPPDAVPGGAVRSAFEAWLNDRWYGRPGLLYLLLPFAALYRSVVSWRRRRLSARAQDIAAQTIVVGNLTVGGSGKTPVVSFIAQRLLAQGRRPCIVSRGYGGRAGSYPRIVTTRSDPAICGDEPVELAELTGCPVIIAPDRAAAARWGTELYGCDCVVSDDGLQHYRLQRDVEILLLSSNRGLGNGHLLPVGPLREPSKRLAEVDLVLQTTGSPIAGSIDRSPPAGVSGDQRPDDFVECRLLPSHFECLVSGRRLELAAARETFGDTPVVALSAIANAGEFHTQLGALGLTVEPLVFADHAAYRGAPLPLSANRTLVTTGKDAVKLRRLEPASGAECWILRRRVQFSDGGLERLDRVCRMGGESGDDD